MAVHLVEMDPRLLRRRHRVPRNDRTLLCLSLANLRSEGVVATGCQYLSSGLMFQPPIYQDASGPSQLFGRTTQVQLA